MLTTPEDAVIVAANSMVLVSDAASEANGIVSTPPDGSFPEATLLIFVDPLTKDVPVGIESVNVRLVAPPEPALLSVKR